MLFAEAPSTRTFNPHVLEPGYAVENVVPGGPNTPSDVAVTADGMVYLLAARTWQLYQVAGNGALTPLATVTGYSVDAGQDDNLYVYDMVGPIYLVTRAGVVTTIGSLPGTSCESTLAVAPDLDLWIGYNYCGGTGFGDSACIG